MTLAIQNQPFGMIVCPVDSHPWMSQRPSSSAQNCFAAGSVFVTSSAGAMEGVPVVDHTQYEGPTVSCSSRRASLTVADEASGPSETLIAEKTRAAIGRVI